MTRENKTEKPNELPDDEWSVPFCPSLSSQSCPFCGGDDERVVDDALDAAEEAELTGIEATLVAEVEAALASLSPIFDEPDDDIPF